MRRPLPQALALLLAAGCATTAPSQGGSTPAAELRPMAAESASEADLPAAEPGPPPPQAARDDELAAFDLQARLAVRARSFLGRRGPFRAAGERFGGDCSGFVEAVYAAEGLSLRELMQ